MTGLSAPFSVQNVARTENVPYTFFYPSAAFNMGRNPGFAVLPGLHHMSDGTIRTSTSAQASTSRLTNSPLNHTNTITDPENGVGGAQDGG